ncbi:3-phosphoshikimate 1-carboxyvinyltransferase [Thermoflexibacter ruber]|uniref:3-phosphoshikimate 1-carboxyvinyltransferase n=1 Tax=Thermoflexibacter ruber TaxID=1003 RepID=A0A1I2DH40_9BACT|nr:3-phosphoshikimate 1-carboxyvinyltransferase [Thermoflexibacter ruber]SFE79834.1 3-phosphoshikimate 1-carboxyvinyltransferase [Thermoflexibacter ruber]
MSNNILSAEAVRIFHPSKQIHTSILLPSSKSESNRVLIINALCKQPCQLNNLSEARDTQTMLRLLASDDLMLDVIDAGTTMRFLTAYCTVINRETILTGSQRMCERPIQVLVEALRELGADIEYMKNEGYPPIHIKKFRPVKNELYMRGDISSQYISALLMAAPALPNGLKINLVGKVASLPYIQMTLQLMQNFGVQHEWNGNSIYVAPQQYHASSYSVESDWSASSYWYSIVSLAHEAEVKLLGLKKDSLQGDAEIVKIMEHLGVSSVFEEDGVWLRKTKTVKDFEWDFTHCPDLAQTIAVLGAAKGVNMKLTGLESLKIKETDRLIAVRDELAKFGIEAKDVNDAELHISPQAMQAPSAMIRTYKDHRMAMAFAPLALLFEISIEKPEVVEKSYPRFWEDLEKAGFEVFA